MPKPLAKGCARCGLSRNNGRWPTPRPDRPNAYYCAKCESDRQNEWRKLQRTKNPLVFKRRDKNTKLKHLFGLNIDQYEQMVKNQNNKCAICDNPEKTRHLAVDHNHNTGQIRKLLCTHCNNLLGNCREQIAVLQKAIRYIEEFTP